MTRPTPNPPAAPPVRPSAEPEAPLAREATRLDLLADAVRQVGYTDRPRRPADVGLRMIAAFIDCVLLIGLILFLVVGAIFVAGAIPDARELGVLLIVFTAPVLYNAIELIWGETLGKKLVDLRVTNRDGSPARFQRRLIRWFCRHGWSCLLFLGFWIWIGAESTGLTRASGRGSAVETCLDMLRSATAVVFLIEVLGSFLAGLPRLRALHDLIAGTNVFSYRDVKKSPTGHAFQPVFTDTTGDTSMHGGDTT